MDTQPIEKQTEDRAALYRALAVAVDNPQDEIAEHRCTKAALQEARQRISDLEQEFIREIHSHQKTLAKLDAAQQERRDPPPFPCLVTEESWARFAESTKPLLREYIDKLTAAHAKMNAAPTPELPEEVAPPPEGWAYYGKGPLEHKSTHFNKDIAMWCFSSKSWATTGWTGTDTAPYALRIGSDIAKKNGIN
jgi:hypothetical protein